MNYDPRPTSENVVVFGHARFVLLTSRLLRLEWAEDGAFEDRATLAVVHRQLPAVNFSCHIDGAKCQLSTADFDLNYTDDGQPFSADNLKVTFKLHDIPVCWTPGLRDDKNLGATLRTLDGVKGDQKSYWHTDAKTGKWTQYWKRINLGNGLISRNGWSFVDDSSNVVMAGDPEWVTPRVDGVRQDWYLLLYGHDYFAAIADAAQIFGQQPLPPRFAFGYWWSRYWAYTDRELEHLVQQFDSHRLPLDVMVIDMDWHLEGWTGYSWDRRYFPDPQEFLRWLKDHDLKITLNLHPADGVSRKEEQFDMMARAMGLDPKTIDRVPFDITDPKYMAAYFKILHHPQEQDGVDFWWMDWQQGASTTMRGLDTLPWINHLHWRDMETNEERQGKRPLIFSRFGGFGAGRYCIGFSGDTFSVWESLRYQPYFTATATNVLYGYWSHDIGGHQPGPIEPELYTRWMQYGMYSPILRTHTSKEPLAERRVWEYPDPYSEIMMDTIRQRYELVPYIYSEARTCYDTGLSLCRPLYYAYPEDAAAYSAKSQYFFGEKLLVAPVVTPVSPTDDMAEVKIWLPEDRWFDTARGCFEEGGRVIRRHYLLSEVPVFVRPGTIIPGQQAPLRIRAGSPSSLLITAYPGGDGEYQLYEDDGVSQGYQTKKFVSIPIAQRETAGERSINIGGSSGDYQGFTPKRSLEIRLPGSVPPESISINAESLAWAYRLAGHGWTYDGDSATIIIRVAAIDVSVKTTITIKKSAVPSSLANGIKGLLARIAGVSAYNAAMMTLHILHPRERLGIDAAQTGNRISHNPATFESEILALQGKVKDLPAMLAKLAEADNSSDAAQRRRASGEKALGILKRIKQERLGYPLKK